LIIIRGVFSRGFVSTLVFVSYTPTLGRKRTREEEEEETRLKGGDPKP
jgi:hypothetical protein